MKLFLWSFISHLHSLLFFLFQPPGTQLIAAPQFLQQTSQQQHQAAAAAAAAGQPTQQQAAVLAQHHKRTAIADPKTGIPMAAYPVAAFSYPSPSQLPTMQFPPPYITAVPMTCKYELSSMMLMFVCRITQIILIKERENRLSVCEHERWTPMIQLWFDLKRKETKTTTSNFDSFSFFSFSSARFAQLKLRWRVSKIP